MKKVGLFLIGGIAAAVLLSQLGSMFGLVISLAILYFVFKQFLKANTKGSKIGWGIVGTIVLCAAVTNLPAIIGIVALYVLFLVFKKWNSTSEKKSASSNDPFANFEKEWAKLKRN